MSLMEMTPIKKMSAFLCIFFIYSFLTNLYSSSSNDSNGENDDIDNEEEEEEEAMSVTFISHFFMSPYKFTSKTHSLSTEDLGKFFIDFFIDSLIHSPFNTAGTFYLKQKNICKMVKKSLENEEKISGK